MGLQLGNYFCIKIKVSFMIVSSTQRPVSLDLATAGQCYNRPEPSSVLPGTVEQTLPGYVFLICSQFFDVVLSFYKWKDCIMNCITNGQVKRFKLK